MVLLLTARIVYILTACILKCSDDEPLTYNNNQARDHDEERCESNLVHSGFSTAFDRFNQKGLIYKRQMFFNDFNFSA